MTDEKKTVSYVSRERMLFEALGWLRSMEHALKELGETRDKLSEENYERNWYPMLSGKTWRDVDDNIELCLKELGKCAERKNKENKENFCIVTKKEGKFHINQHPSEFHDPSHKSIVLMDNNILWNKDWFMEVTDWIMEKRMKVDFNQGLDIRLVDNDIAKRISELRPIKNWHFAFDSLNYKDEVIRGIEILKRNNVNVRNNSNWYVYLHEDSQFDDALERITILKENDALPYLMINPESKKTKRMADLKRYTRPWVFFSMDFKDYRRSLA